MAIEGWHCVDKSWVYSLFNHASLCVPINSGGRQAILTAFIERKY
jgi:hypothetical protein